MTAEPIHLLLVDDQDIIRQGLRSLLETHADLRVVGEAENGKQAVQTIEALHNTPQVVDVVLMDIRMPIMDGVAATQIIRQRFSDIKVLVLSTFDDDVYVAQAMQAGANGYLLKNTRSPDLAIAIRSVHRGFTQLGPGLFEKAMTPVPAETALPPGLESLTAREREVLCLIAAGSTNREIAEALFISEYTVKNHISSILNRLNLRDRTQAAVLASSFLPFLQP